MRHKKNNIFIAVFLVVLIQGLLMAKTVHAASATIVLDVLSENVQVGDTFSVSVTVSSSTAIGEVSQAIRYDAGKLKFETETSKYEEQNGVITIKDTDASEVKEKYILRFKALTEGTAKIEVSGMPEIHSTDGNLLSFSSHKLSVPIGERKVKSKNCNLASLSIGEGKLVETFEKNKTAYTMHVGQEVTKLTITAKPEDQTSKVEVSGANKLLVGSNTVKIVVTSESGRKKEYVLAVNRGDMVIPTELPQTTDAVYSPGPEETAKPEVKQEERTETLAEGILSLNGTSQYELLSLEQMRTLPKGYLSIALEIDGQRVDAYQLENGKDEQVYLLYAKNTQGETGFYLYDAKEKTMQRYVKNVLEEERPLLTGAIEIDVYNSKVRELSMITGICAGLVVLMTYIAVHFYKKSRE